MNGQIIFDLGEPRQHDIAFPLSLAEKYRPQLLTQFAGLLEAKQVFAALLAQPRPCNLMLVGPPGGRLGVHLGWSASWPHLRCMLPQNWVRRFQRPRGSPSLVIRASVFWRSRPPAILEELVGKLRRAKAWRSRGGSAMKL